MFKFKNYLVCFCVCVLIFMLPACTSPFTSKREDVQQNQVIIQSNEGKDNITKQSNELLKDMSADALKTEDKFIQAEAVLNDFINSGRIMIREFDKIHPQLQENGRYNTIELGQMAREWREALNFGGAHYDIGALIHQLGYTPDDYFMFHQMNIDGQEGQRILEHNIYFTKDFEKINMTRYAKMIKGVFGVEIATEDIKEAVLVCEKELLSLDKGGQVDHILYEKDDITIKVVALHDALGNKYVAICSRYIPQ